MTTSDPSTWHDLSKHPALKGSTFNSGWYDGDVNADLNMLRNVATEILSRHPRSTCELVLLDDCTMYITVEMSDSTRCSIYPAKNDNFTPCYFVDIERIDDEKWVESVEDVLSALNRS